MVYCSAKREIHPTADITAVGARMPLVAFHVNLDTDNLEIAKSISKAVRGAWLNVLINLGGLKDAAAAEAYRAKGKLLLDKTCAIGEEIYRSVEAAL